MRREVKIDARRLKVNPDAHRTEDSTKTLGNLKLKVF